MPKNCCVPLCKSNASRNPELCYHELPSKENLRNAWLRKHFPEKGLTKGSHWQPSSRTVVCSLHFTADDYKAKAVFVTSEDDRLAWLEVDFIGYLEDIKLESAKCRAKSLTKETYEATIMTTRSTVAVEEYLLNDVEQLQVHLDAGLNSNPVESLFSCFRQINGGDDRADARTAVFTAEKLLKVGILEAARSGNAPSSSQCQTALKVTNTLHGARIPAIPDEALAVLWRIQHVMKYDEVPVLFDFTALVYLAGYLAFVCEEKQSPFLSVLDASLLISARLPPADLLKTLFECRISPLLAAKSSSPDASTKKAGHTKDLTAAPVDDAYATPQRLPYENSKIQDAAEAHAVYLFSQMTPRQQDASSPKTPQVMAQHGHMAQAAWSPSTQDILAITSMPH
ncbi:hypothetical protein MTO96_035203 [Rhipicephalus appendiculatus]